MVRKVRIDPILAKKLNVEDRRWVIILEVKDIGIAIQAVIMHLLRLGQDLQSRRALRGLGKKYLCVLARGVFVIKFFSRDRTSAGFLKNQQQKSAQ